MIYTREEVVEKTKDRIRERYPRDGSVFYLIRESFVLGFTSGCYDIFHADHLHFLREARKSLGPYGVLVVGVNSDRSTRELKGPGRPIISQDLRAELVSNLMVDYVFIFDELNNEANIKLLKPDVYFKGSDYNPENLGSAKFLEGGRVQIINSPKRLFTSQIIKKIRNEV